MPFKRHKIFASGVHKQTDPALAVWPAERVKALFETSKASSPKHIPYTFRHPQNNLPVLGFAERDSLELLDEGGRTYLTIQPKEMAGEFLTGLKKVGFDQVSVGLGKLGEIVHVGFTDNPAVVGLGAAFEASANVPPVYLEEVEFSADDLGLKAAFDVSWKWQLQSWMADVADLFGRLRDKSIEADGLDTADKFLPPYILDFLKAPLPPDAPEPGEAGDGPDGGASPVPTYESDTMTDQEKQELKRLQDENNRLLGESTARIAADRKAAVVKFCDDNPAIIIPAIRPQVEAILSALQGVEAPVSFESTDDAGAKTTVERTAFEALCGLLAGAKPQVVFEEAATHGNAPASEEPNPTVDPVKVELQAQFEAAKKLPAA